MGWPKGKPRKGYVKKDGTKPLGWGERKVGVKSPSTEPKVQVIRKPDPTVETVAKVLPSNYKVTIAPCPKCGTPDAFTYCDNCGWYRYDPTCPHCKKGK